MWADDTSSWTGFEHGHTLSDPVAFTQTGSGAVQASYGLYFYGFPLDPVVLCTLFVYPWYPCV